MKRVKVLQLQPNYNVRQYNFADLAEQIVLSLPADRYQVTSAFLSGRPGPGQPVSSAERSVHFDFPPAKVKGLRLRALWRLYRYCKVEQFDVIIAHRFKPISMMLSLAAKMPATRFIGIVHGFGDFDRRYRQSQVKRLTDDKWRFVGVSPAVREHLLDYHCGFTPRNTLAITNAIDLDQIAVLQVSAQAARQQLNLPLDAVLIGTIGRLVPVKGHHYLINAFARIKARYPKAQLVIIGEGRERQALEQEIVSQGVQNRVHLLGNIPDAVRYVRAFDIWVMPSLSEGLGLALLEGMSGELPVIASDVPAMRPIVEGASGLLVTPGNAESLAEALDAYLGLSVAERLDKGREALSYLKTRHPIEDYRQSYRSLIEEFLGNRS